MESKKAVNENQSQQLWVFDIFYLTWFFRQKQKFEKKKEKIVRTQELVKAKWRSEMRIVRFEGRQKI